MAHSTSNRGTWSGPTPNNRGNRFRAQILALLCTLFAFAPIFAMTPMEYLSVQAKPVFRQGHTLLPLARCGWPGTAFEGCKELADYWGYSLPLSGWLASIDTAIHARLILNDPMSYDSRLIQLAAANPQKYKLHIYIDRALPSYQECPSCYCRTPDGTPVANGTLWSPEAPDSVLREYAKKRVASFRMIKMFAPVFLASNMGEYGLAVPASSESFALDTMVNNRAAGNWWGYISERKAHQELILDSLIKLELADGGNYYYYANGGQSIRNRWWGWGDWGWIIEAMKDLSQYPSEEAYYNYGNTGYVNDPTQSGYAHILAARLNAKGWEISLSKPLSYDWLSAGWNQPGFGDVKRWMGFLKCSYTAGMIGANVGFYQYVPDAAPFDSSVDSLSQWLYSVIAQGRAQALFSWIDPFLRNGDLLPGPNMHRYSTEHPAYEFPVAGDDSARVLVRKLTTQDRWIITAWAAAGASRDVDVTIPALGTVTVRARAAGSVYHARLNGTTAVLTMLDSDSLCVTFDTTTLKAQLGDLYGVTAAIASSPTNRRFMSTGPRIVLNHRTNIFDMRGRLVYRMGESRYRSLQPGVYVQSGSPIGTMISRERNTSVLR